MTNKDSLGTVTKANLVEELDKLLGTGEENYTIEPDNEVGPWTVKVTKTGYTTKISSTGKTEEIADQTTTTFTIETLMTTASTKNETVLDAYGNKIVVPAGFKIVAHDTNYVTYTYHTENGTATNIPVVQDGIVIKNATDGNEFVWVPVGTIKNDAVENTTNTTTITLARYSNGETVQVSNKTDYNNPVGIKNSSTDAFEFIEISKNFEGTTIGETVYSSADTYENGKSYNLQEWITTTLDNNGYYIGRFEASNNGSDQAVMLSASSAPWTNITQPNATIQAQAIYSAETGTNKDLYYSDLVNSYAWDTAYEFMRIYSDGSDYKDLSVDTWSFDDAHTFGFRAVLCVK